MHEPTMRGMTMPCDEAVHLSGLICSRLCHDLVGPAGALANGLELCEDPAMIGSALGVMKETSGELNLRLAFYRRAFGTGGNLTWDEAQDLTRQYLDGKRHELTWHQGEVDGSDEAAALARLAMNLVLCALDTLPTGGDIVLSAGPAPRVEASGNLGDLENLLDAFTGGDRAWEGLTPRHVQPYWTAMLAEHAGGKMAVHFDPGVRLLLAYEPGE